MSARILSTFEKAKAEGRPVFVPFVTAGFPSQQATVPLLLALEQGGADLIELGVPHTDPLADGPTIQEASAGTPQKIKFKLNKIKYINNFTIIVSHDKNNQK
jgi:tryptophan synthase alpha subunit